MIESQATYLAWSDCSNVTADAEKLFQFIRKNTGVYLTSGEVFGSNGKISYSSKLCNNLNRVKDGMNRLLKGIELYQSNGSIKAI